MKGEGGAYYLRQTPGLPALAGRGAVGAPESSRLLPIRPVLPHQVQLARDRLNRTIHGACLTTGHLSFLSSGWDWPAAGS